MVDGNVRLSSESLKQDLAKGLVGAGADVIDIGLTSTDFPNGIPNPRLPGNRAATAEAVNAHDTDFGITWDGGFGRCYLFYEKVNSTIEDHRSKRALVQGEDRERGHSILM